MHLLDSDTLSHLWGNHERVVDRLDKCEDTEIGTTSVTKSEILRARCENLLKATSTADLLIAQQRFDRSEALLAELMILPFDEAAAKELDRLKAIKKLKKIDHADLLIAAVALANRAVLVTRNLRDFQQVPKLTVENWVD